MTSWQIFSDAGNNFRWEISDQHLCTNPDEKPTTAPIQRSDSTPPRLPSMADLLIQGRSKLMESWSGDFESSPMFRSGLGKSVTVKHSSISKALSILGDEDDAFAANTGQLCSGHDNGYSSSNSMFQTGSGKTVNISSAGLVRAKTLLGLEQNYEQENLQGLEPTRKQLSASKPLGRRSLSHSGMKEEITSTRSKGAASVPIPALSSLGSDSKREDIPDLMNSAARPPPIKFHTAGGRSISVSTDALHRARSLLGDLELGTFSDDADANDPAFSFCKGGYHDNILNKENNLYTIFSHQETPKNKQVSKSFTSPLRLSSSGMRPFVMSENISSGSNLIKKFDAEECDSSLYKNTPSPQKPLSNRPHVPHVILGNSLANDIGSRIIPQGRSFSGPLTDISNTISMDSRDKSHTGEKRRFGMKSSISPFKRPRSSKFVTPLYSNMSLVPNGSSNLAPEESCCKRRVSTRYPIQVPRTYLKEYFGMPNFHQSKFEQLPENVRRMNPDNAEKYMFCDASGLNCIGAEAFRLMLAQSGASMQNTSKEWVANHYKWIVWKLSCYERCYPSKSSGKLLTVSNVLEELKYRYERELNHGHRSAIKRILEGDALPSSMMVLCISSVHSNGDPEIENHSITSNGAENGSATKIELTDGWYSMTAFLDGMLLKELAAGKLFVGQKLRIWGAGLSGWIGPVSPIESQASRMASLLLHINGTYRAHWADRLGLCKGDGAPLAFRCIKATGGLVPSTLVGVTRIYPVLYRERLSNGGFIVRSERMEHHVMQLYNQRRSTVAEGIVSEFQRGVNDSDIINNNDGEEGAKILKILETAAEPEVLMAEMSSEQLTSFAAYQAKQEAIRQSDMQKSIEKALEDTGLSAREVTPFMRVRVVGLTSKRFLQTCHPQKGLVTIWNPTEKHQFELVEGQAYAIAGLIPLSSDSDTLYLQAKESTTKWLPLPPSAMKQFEPFFSPRVSVLLSNFGEVPLSSEFDIAALVVYVGEVYTDTHQKKQWVFVTDGSTSKLDVHDTSNSLLAISFCSPYNDVESFAPVNCNLAGSTVGFCNLIKRPKDQMNHIWVAGATENSTYFLSYDSAHCSHLKDAASSAQRWAQVSSLKIEKLREKVLSIVGNCGG